MATGARKVNDKLLALMAEHLDAERVKVLVGIDPGQHNGLGINVRVGRINNPILSTLDFWELVDVLEDILQLQMLYGRDRVGVTVYIEDTRLNTPVFDRGNDGRRQLRQAQNVGDNKRTAGLLVEYLERKSIPFHPIRPNGKTYSKLNADTFTRYTGITERCSQHARDAYMLIHGIH